MSLTTTTLPPCRQYVIDQNNVLLRRKELICSCGKVYKYEDALIEALKTENVLLSKMSVVFGIDTL